MPDYKDDQPDRLPPWAADANGLAWGRALGDQKDALIHEHKAGVKARFPDYASEQALAEIGAERGIERGTGESAASYAARLKGAWEAWPWAGTAYGLLNALYDAGYTNARVSIFRQMEYALDANRQLTTEVLGPGAWRFRSGAQTFWSLFIVLIPRPWPTFWGGSIPSSGSDIANALRRLISTWKSGHSTCDQILIQQVDGSSRTWDYHPLAITWDNQERLTWDADAATPWVSWTP